MFDEKLLLPATFVCHIDYEFTNSLLLAACSSAISASRWICLMSERKRELRVSSRLEMKPEVLLLTLRSAHSLVLQCELRVALGGGREEAHVTVVLFSDIAFSMIGFCPVFIHNSRFEFSLICRGYITFFKIEDDIPGRRFRRWAAVLECRVPEGTGCPNRSGCQSSV